MAKNFRDKRPCSTETVHLGTYIHPCEDLLVLKLEHRDIPYPNSPVVQGGKPIGKIDEVFGPVDNVFVSVRLEGAKTVKDFKIEARLEGYKDKFIFKDRFLPREEVERKKERDDRSKKSLQKKDFKSGGSFRGKGGFNDKKKQNFGDSKYKGGGFGNKSRGNDSYGKGTKDGGNRKDFRKRSD